MLQIRLFGECTLRHGEVVLPSLESTRTASLLAYLLLHRRAAQSRQHLAFLLWPDSNEAQARTNLRHVLHNLRRVLPAPDSFLEVTPRTIQWRVNAPYWLDVETFEETVARVEGAGDDAAVGVLRAAVDLYSADLLEGHYEEWVLAERERLRRRVVAALERLTRMLEARGELAAAIGYAERLLRHDPLDEATYRHLMRLHDARGDRARALRVYHVCAATLERELDVEPSRETVAAYEALLPAQREPGDGSPGNARVGGPPLVGRAAEWQQLTGLWQETAQGGARFVLVSGEPGVGKSRLAEDYRGWVTHRGGVTAVARAYPAEGALAYGPLVEWLRAESLRTRGERLDQTLLLPLAPLVPELLSRIPTPTFADSLPPGAQRQRLFDAAARVLAPAGEALLLVAEDLHWWDPETLQFLHYLLRVHAEARLLVLGTARREETEPGDALNHLVGACQTWGAFTEIELGRLSREETALLAERLRGHSLDEKSARRLHSETEGNPLFVVEAVRAGWRDGPTGGVRVTPRVQAVIEARLGQLSEAARALVGLAAAIGREFTSDLLAAASGFSEPTLVRALDELWRRRIVREQSAYAYDYSHDKIREVAYLVLGPAQRRQHHLRIAEALKRRHAGAPEPVSGRIAAHCERAGAMGEAIVWYETAARAAQRLHASGDAVRFLERALELLRSLPAGAERASLELRLLTALPAPLVAVEGYLSPRVAAVHERGLELARALDVEPEPPLIRSLAMATLTRGEYEAARPLGEQLRARAERDGDAVLWVESAYVLGVAAFWQGQLATARREFVAALQHCRPGRRNEHLLHYGQDPEVFCGLRLAYTLWFLGEPDEACRARDAALARAERAGQPFTRSSTLAWAAALALDQGDDDRLREYVTALRAEPAEEISVPTRLFTSLLEEFLAIIDARRKMGVQRVWNLVHEVCAGEPSAPGIRGMHMRILLEACARAGDATAGLEAADQALDMGGGTQLWEPEIRRLRAGFLAARGAAPEQVEAELRRALEVARRQGAETILRRIQVQWRSAALWIADPKDATVATAATAARGKRRKHRAT